MKFAYVWNDRTIHVAELSTAESDFSSLDFESNTICALDFHMNIPSNAPMKAGSMVGKSTTYLICFNNQEEKIEASSITSALEQSKLLAESPHGARGSYQEIAS